MKKLLLFAAAAAVLASCAPKTAPELPMETFFRNSEKTGYQISPDGRYFSYMAPYESRRNIFVQPVDGKQAVRITSETERDLAGYFWAGDNRILYLKDTGGDENYQLYGVNIDGSDPKAYTAIPGVRTQIIDPLEEIDSLIIIGTNQRNPMIFDPYRLNLNTGEMTMLCENPGDIQGWQTDHNGRLRVAYAIVDGVNSQIRYRETEAEPFRPVLTTNFKESVSFAAFTPDNKQVYAVTNLGRDKVALVLMDPATCEEKEELYTNDTNDLAGVWYSEKPQTVVWVRKATTKTPPVSFALLRSCIRRPAQKRGRRRCGRRDSGPFRPRPVRCPGHSNSCRIRPAGCSGTVHRGQTSASPSCAALPAASASAASRAMRLSTLGSIQVTLSSPGSLRAIRALILMPISVNMPSCSVRMFHSGSFSCRSKVFQVIS